MLNNRNLWANLMNTKKDLDKILNKLKTLREEFNNLFLKIQTLEKNFMGHKKIWDYQLNNNKSYSTKSTNTKSNLPQTMLNQKLTEWKYKNYWMKTTNLENKLETLNKTLDCQLHKSVSWTMSLKLLAMNMNNLRESSNNSVAILTKSSLIMKTKLLCYHKSWKDWTELLKERIMKSEL